MRLSGVGRVPDGGEGRGAEQVAGGRWQVAGCRGGRSEGYRVPGAGRGFPGVSTPDQTGWSAF